MARGDLDRVVEIARASLPEAWTFDGFASELEKRTSACVVLGDPIRGFAIGSIVVDEMEVLTIAVDPQVRRAGSGRGLLDALIGIARGRGARHAHLEVRAGNASAIALYAHAGFERTGMRPRYYADGEDALLMTRAI